MFGKYSSTKILINRENYDMSQFSKTVGKLTDSYSIVTNTVKYKYKQMININKKLNKFKLYFHIKF